jgi:hypothetical protein
VVCVVEQLSGSAEHEGDSLRHTLKHELGQLRGLARVDPLGVMSYNPSLRIPC